MLRILCVCALCFPLTAQAACPRSLTGTYSGAGVLHSFEGEQYKNAVSAIFRISFQRSDGSTTAFVSYVFKSADEAVATRVQETASVSFNPSTCEGILTLSDGVQDVFTITDSGKQLFGTLLNDEPGKSLAGYYQLIRQ
jgi:hypothetical protein